MYKYKLKPSILINLTLTRLNNLGMNPMNKSGSYTVVNATLAFLQAMQLIMIVLRCITKEYETDGERLLDYMTLGGTYQQLLRPLIFLIHKQKLSELVKIIHEKYNISTEYLNNKQHLKIQVLYKYLYQFQTIYTNMTIIATIGYLAGSAVNKQFVANIWPENLQEYVMNSVYFPLAWMLQSSVVGIGIYVLSQQDLLVFIFVITTLIEMNKLKYKFASIGRGNQDDIIIKQCIEMHNFLLECLEKVEEMFAPIVLQLLGTNGLLSAVALFGLLSDIPLTKKIVCTTGISVATYQFLAFCILGQIVQDQTTSIAEAAYSSNWEEITDIKIRKALVSCIQRSQKPFYITIGGFQKLSLECFKQVAQMIFSVATLILRSRNSL